MDRILQHSSDSSHFKAVRAECLALLGRYQEAQEAAKYFSLISTIYIFFNHFLFLSEIIVKDQTNVDEIYVRGICLYY